jgi:hypothetical protein
VGGDAGAGESAQSSEEKMKKNYEDFMQIIEKESKKEVPLPKKHSNGNSVNLL